MDSTHWLIRRISTVLRSNSSNQGKAAMPSRAGCIPASSWSVKFQYMLPITEQGILSYHDRLALVLDDVTGSSHLISPAQA